MKRSLRVFSRHPSHDPLRKGLMLPVLTLLRLGSVTTSHTKYEIELNSPDSIRNSASKLRMKERFTESGVKTPNWWIVKEVNKTHFIDSDNKGTNIQALPYPIVAKHHFGSRGTGNYKLNSKEELEQWMKGKDLSKYILEVFHNMAREYRLHIAKGLGCFYACRKLLKNDTPQDKRWSRHMDTSIWAIETNPSFSKPVNWNDIVADCEKALESLGGDIMAFDVKVQSAKNSEGQVRENPEWVILESNSAASLLTVGLEKYREIIPKLVSLKVKS